MAEDQAPDPLLRAALRKQYMDALAEFEAEEKQYEGCDHREEYGRVKKFDGGKLPVLCGRCSTILYWNR